MARFFFKSIFSPGPKYSVLTAFTVIFLSALICVPTFCLLLFPNQALISKTKDYPIKNLFLKPTSLHKLPGIVFSELLGLFADESTSLQSFSITQAENTLNRLGIFSSLSIKKVPDYKGIAIFYALKEPIAYVANQSNMLFDLEGDLFPCLPYFPSLNLPQVFFPEHDLSSSNIPKEKTLLITRLLQEFPSLSMTIDLTTYDTYPGEILISLPSGDFLRLPKQDFSSAIQLYKQAKKHPLIDSNCSYIYDLRFPCTLLLKQQCNPF